MSFLNRIFLASMKTKLLSLFHTGSILTSFILLSSCSMDVTKSPREAPESFLSPKYEDESFENVSMDICYPNPQYELIPGSDTAHIQSLIEFEEAFKNYFPDGIMLFSTITKVGWLFFDVDYESDIIEYHRKTEDSLNIYVFLPDSLTNFQRKSEADFLFIIQYGAVMQSPPDSTDPQSRYSTTYDIGYSVWDLKNSDLIAMDKVSSKVEFDKFVDHWPYRAVINKSAALIFEKLPMFEK